MFSRMLYELKHVCSEWLEIGIYLGIESSKLMEIRKNDRDINNRKIQMLTVWRNQFGLNWNDLVLALLKSSGDCLTSALDIADRFCRNQGTSVYIILC